jgi:TPP-dependent indolepyruvate ferredoxin oxidoreductase alpha subunit
MVIGGYPGAPSSSQLETVQALKKEFQDHQKTWASLQSGELKKFTAELAKANRPPAVIKPKEVFLKES